MIKPYYQDEWVTIYNGDCREVLPQLPDKSIDLVLTDPPYPNLKGGTEHWSTRGVAKVFNRSYTVGTPWNDSLDWMDTIFNKFNLGMFVFCSYHSVSAVQVYISGLEPVALISWFKRNSAPPVNNVPHFQNEFIWALKKEPGLIWRNIKTHYDIPSLAGGCMASERFLNLDKTTLHPTQKPLELIRELLKVKPDTVIDPFLGTGTTLRACKELSIKSIGIEISEKYCEIAAKRCMQTVMNFEPVKEKPKQGVLMS